MSESTVDLSAAIQQLEAQNRRLRLWGLGAVVLVTGALAWVGLVLGQLSRTMRSETQIVNRVIVRDGEGRTRATFGISDQEPDVVLLELVDPQGHEQLVLSVNGEGAALVSIAGKGGKSSAALGVGGDDVPFIELRDAHDQTLFRKP